MHDWNVEQFAKYFDALWRPAGSDKPVEPFPWQTRLAERVLEEPSRPWPQAIALPTAAGKTACIDIAIFALAARPNLSPRRIYFIVDRRVIVDEAFERARKLTNKLGAADHGILKQVAEALRSLSSGDDPLAVFQLRGGIYRDDAWARTPLQPTVICSTVDQIGSRLLYRGYGRSPKAWPIHAGLAGNDSLFLLDEAHCAQPFLETLKAVEKYRGWAESPLTTPFQAVVMSATPPAGLDDVLRESLEDLDHPVLRRRFKADKPTAMVVAEKAKGKNWRQPLAEKLAQEALDLLGEGRAAIAVMVNRVATAKAVYDLLAKHQWETVLFTGRMRPLDRDEITRDCLTKLNAAASGQRLLEKPLFVVATQTLEVGANLDFDGLVTECASLDALRQRFGRLNRAGRDVAARGVIVVRADQTEDSADDPVYGASLTATWCWLRDRSQNGVIDFGVYAFSILLPEDPQRRAELLHKLNAPNEHAPVLLPSHVDMLVQTAPVPQPSPDVALLLHGPQRGTPDVQVCWRADLTCEAIDEPTEDERERWQDALALCPPATAECAPVPLSQLRRWLAGEVTTADYADVEGGNVEWESSPKQHEKRWVVRWVGREDSETIHDPRDIRSGDVVVIPAQYQGWETLAQLPSNEKYPAWLDVAEGAHLQARGLALLRLNSEVLKQWPEGAARERLFAIARMTQDERETLDDDELEDQLRGALTLPHEEELELPAWLLGVITALERERSLIRLFSSHPCGGWILRGRRRINPATGIAFTDEDDASASGTVRVPLTKHLQGVEDFARRYAEGCRLPANLIEDVALAGLFHDLGKADPRFQALLNGGNRWAVGGELLAKSGNISQDRKAYRQALGRSGYPQGGRHELLSVRLVESEPNLLAGAHDRDLVLHLIASHHGHCRPFAPVIFDESPNPVKLEFNGHMLSHSSATGMERLDSGVADRFWRLVRRYGWWGLAWLEAILRLADHRRSEWEARSGENDHE